jgi:hypothetical protein
VPGFLPPLAVAYSVSFYLAGLILGFLVGAIGHLVKATVMIVTGIALVAVTAAVFVLSNA